MELTKDSYFENMYRDYYRKVFNFARRLCGNHDQAEDLTQEAFMRAYSAMDTQSSGGKVDNWLMRIVYNLFLDSRRRASRRVKEINETRLDDDGLDQFSDTRQNIEDILVRNTYDSPVMKVIESLSQDEKELLKMAYIDRLPHDEIGRILGVRTGTARSRIHRLCQQIRRTTMVKTGGNERFASNLGSPIAA